MLLSGLPPEEEKPAAPPNSNGALPRPVLGRTGRPWAIRLSRSLRQRLCCSIIRLFAAWLMVPAPPTQSIGATPFAPCCTCRMLNELCFSFHYFALRKLHFLLRAKALVAFPGGYGTFDELFEVLTLIQTRKIKPIPVVLVGEAYWRHAVDIDFLVDEGVIDSEDRELFWFAETAEEIWNGILHWHDASGEPLHVAPCETI